MIAALRLTRLFVPALAESNGSVVMINSMVVRFSQRTMGPYKLAKAALLAMAQSLATELGPQGIRVNSVAPGHIWGDSLKWYFGYLAKKRGVTVEQVYAETAAPIDLGRLPEPDEIADAVVFLASPHGTGHHRPVPGRQLRRVPPLSSANPARRTVEDLHASATRRTGLADFGADDYTDGLAVLLDSYDREAGLTPLGAKMQRAFLRGALTARLFSEAAWQANPAYAEVGHRPAGIRHRAAPDRHHGAAPAAHRGPGQPGPGDVARAGAAAPPAAAHLAGQPGLPGTSRRASPRHHEEHPEFMGVHYMAADQVEECWQLLQQSMRSISFETLALRARLLGVAARAGLDRRPTGGTGATSS